MSRVERNGLRRKSSAPDEMEPRRVSGCISTLDQRPGSAARFSGPDQRPRGISMEAPMVRLRGSTIGLTEPINRLVSVFLAPGRYKERWFNT
jgi:hypothetical protein